MLLSGRVAEALDLSREDARLIDAYDTARFAARDNWGQAVRGRAGLYTGHAKSFGKCLLLARRLCEAGSRLCDRARRLRRRLGLPRGRQ